MGNLFHTPTQASVACHFFFVRILTKSNDRICSMSIAEQTKLVSELDELHLENDLSESMASQAAISLKNASLYSDLQRSEAFLAEAQSLSHTGGFGWSVANGEIYCSAETYNIFELDRAAKPTLEMVLRRTHPDDRDLMQQALDRASEARSDFDEVMESCGCPSRLCDFEFRLLMPDGSVK